MTAVDIVLPRAPSTNRLWVTGRGRMYRSPEYTSWIAECLVLIRQQRVGKVLGRYEMVIRVKRTDKRKKDIDNYIKGIADLMQHAGVIEDDCLCEKITSQWVYDGPPVLVTITPLGEQNDDLQGTATGTLSSGPGASGDGLKARRRSGGADRS